MCIHMSKSLVVVFLCFGFVASAGAVPSVKRLSETNAFAGTQGAAAAKTAAVSAPRVGSLNSNRIVGVLKPTATSKVNNSVATKDANAARFSFGNYITNAMVKPVTGGGSTVSGSDITDVKNRLNVAEGDLSNVKSDIVSLQHHTTDNDMHVTSSEKADWNAKQDALTAGQGIKIENNVISSTVADSASVTDADKARWNAKQDTLVAGENISIVDGVISANAGSNISVVDTDSNSGRAITGISANDNVVTVSRSNVKLPVGSENGSALATIWVEY